ncbi:MAG: CYTH domain-containing protein [Johnsonella sp.]|nr:CYTH domain-containing protein [Johnsonella sp.]
MDTKKRNTEIERKYLVRELPEHLEKFPHQKYIQGYLNISPVIRVRAEAGNYFLTYKSSGMLLREEYNLPLDQKSFEHLLQKCEGYIIKKTRYFIPLDPSPGLVAELDLFEDELKDLILAEVEFSSKKEADSFTPPSWFGEEVSEKPQYYNSYLSKYGYRPD